MSTSKQKIENAEIFIRCTKCGKLLAKVLSCNHLEIKCTRCGVFNFGSKPIKEGDKVIVINSCICGNVLHTNKNKNKK